MNGCVRQRGFRSRESENHAQQMDLRRSQRRRGGGYGSDRRLPLQRCGGRVYRFVWNRFCDWYVEFAKPVFMGSDEAAKAETQAMAAWALDEILKLLHPFMPFVTEELWAVLGEEGPERETLLCLADWPKPAKKADRKAVDEVNWVIDLISEIRSLRSEMNVPAASTLPLTITGAGQGNQGTRQAL